MNLKLFRCASVASDNLHDHHNGTLMVRPSTRCAVISSFVTSTARALGTLGGWAAVLTPDLQHPNAVFKDNAFDHVEVTRGEAIRVCQQDWVEPVLAFSFVATRMNVWRFRAV